MKLTIDSKQAKRLGFTLIEMIGVLAIIAVLAGLLLPRIFEAINEARINSAALGYNTAKSASMGYFGKYGRFGDGSGVAYTNDLSAGQDWGTVLLQTGFLDKPFSTRIGTTSEIQIISTASGAVDGSNSAYNFDDSGTANQATGGAVVIQVKLEDVALSDARALSLRVDGETLSEPAGDSDLVGKVKYDFSGSPTGDVFMYIAHK